MALELVSTASDIASQVKAVNQLLEAGEPHNISVDSFSGFTGYKPQYIVDAMNEAFGYGGWGFEEISNEIAEGEKATLIISQVRVFLKDVAFQPSGWGQARITKGDIGDARKGAQTDAIKKALSYFSIGNRAYRGLLKEDGKSNSTHVKSIHTQQNGNKQPQQNKEAADVTPLAEVPTSAQLKARCTKLFGDGKWETVKERLLGKSIADDDIKPADCRKIDLDFKVREEAKKAS